MVHLMQRRKVNVLCLQETKRKGQKAREISNGYKPYYKEVDVKGNDVGIVLDSELTKGVLFVSRESNRLIWTEL